MRGGVGKWCALAPAVHELPIPRCHPALGVMVLQGLRTPEIYIVIYIVSKLHILKKKKVCASVCSCTWAHIHTIYIFLDKMIYSQNLSVNELLVKVVINLAIETKKKIMAVYRHAAVDPSGVKSLIV